MAVVNCPNCAEPLRCGTCSHYVDAEQAAMLLENTFGKPMAGTDTGEPTSSSGRTPMWDTSPRTRTAFLDGLGERARAAAISSLAAKERDSTPGHIARVVAAEKLVEACEADRDAAYETLRHAEADKPEMVAQRALTQEQLDAFHRAVEAQALAVRTEQALTRAKLALARELEVFERVSAPLPSPEDFRPGLSPIDRDRGAARTTDRQRQAAQPDPDWYRRA